MKRISLFLLLFLFSCTNDPIVYTLTATAEPAEGGQVVPEFMEYGEGDTAYVVATPSDEYVLESWSGDASGNANTIVLTMDKNKEVTANFIKKKYPLTIKIEGEGEVKQDIIKEGIVTDYFSGSIVKLTATPEEEWEFVRWRGDLTGNENPTQITMDEPKTVVAEFIKKKYSLTVEIIGEGDVDQRVIKQGASTDYNSGTVVELTALSDEDWKFIEWRGDLTGDKNPQNISIEGPKKVTAVFEEEIDCSDLSITSTLSDFNDYNISCHGASDGSIDVTVSGGNGGYKYSWSTKNGNGLVQDNEDQNGLSPGIYILTVTDSKECKVSKEFTITEPDEIKIITTISDYNGYGISENGGNDGSIELSVSGGIGEYSFKWSTQNGSGLDINNQNQANLTAGIYKVTVTDQNGCEESLEITLIEPGDSNQNCNDFLIIGTVSNYNGYGTSCDGQNDGSIDITVSGGTTDYTYQWSKEEDVSFSANTQDISSLSPGTYNVTATDAMGCVDIVSFTITEPDEIQVSSELSNVSEHGGSDGSIDITVSGGTGSYTYFWSSNNGSGMNQGQDDQTGLTAGTYKLQVTDSNGCIKEKTFEITEPNEKDNIIGTWILTNEQWVGSGTWPEGQARGCWKSGDQGSPDQYIFTESSVTKKVWECHQDGTLAVDLVTYGPISWSNQGSGNYQWGGQTIQVVFENNNTIMKLPFDDGNILQTWTKN